MEISNERLKELVVDLLMSITDNCYEHSEKLNVIKGSCITAEELKELGFDYVNTWFEDANMEDVDEGWEWDEPLADYIPSAENGDYSPSNPWDAPGMSMSDFI
jgi:hypothetical protein